MSIKKLFDRLLRGDINVTDEPGLKKLFSSHLVEGKRFERLGMFEEAIREYSKEHSRAIEDENDMEIVQSSYAYVGVVYLKSKKWGQAIEFFQKARAHMLQFGYGTGVDADLVEAYVQLGRFDDAIQICQNWIPSWDNKVAEYVLKDTLEKKRQAENSR